MSKRIVWLYGSTLIKAGTQAETDPKGQKPNRDAKGGAATGVSR